MTYRCDACGKTGDGIKSEQYQYLLPPNGWVWVFWGPLYGPHACSPECWVKVQYSDDGKIYLDWDHAKEAGSKPQPARVAPRPSLPPPPVKPTRKPRQVKAIPIRTRVEKLEVRVDALEVRP
jgi:hypothetical protein